MNKNIKLAVAGAVLALSASAANAGIIIPAGDWTVDINGNVNSFFTRTKQSGNQRNTTAGSEDAPVTIQTGLLPSSFGIGAKTRQNDLDVAFQFSFWTGSSANGGDNLNNVATNGGLGYSSLNIRQSYLTFGDKSWGSVLVGRNLGVFGSDAILSDMTLLGVGSGASGANNSSTLGRIGSGYIYSDWKAQIAYTTPNFNGFEATAAVTEGTGQLDNSNLGYEGKASYSFAANDVTGKIWVGGKSLKIQNTVTAELDAQAAEIGGKVGASGFDLVGYYYDGKNVDQGIGVAHATSTSATVYDRDNSGGYVQATYVMPFKTKLGVSYGLSKIDKRASEAYDAERKATIVGAYHPLTKHLNLVAEYNHLDVETHTNNNGKAKTMSLGAILFF
ncbi:porin [Candidatus Methylopumilus planktonicus]|uniref:porin n=1 Tax=Candidatus Methylopumilus planktonicus TaxID=1581557 RepID=UPI003BEF1476